VNIDIKGLQENLCNAFCRDIVVPKHDNNFIISLPLIARDGGRLNAYAKPINGGGKIS